MLILNVLKLVSFTSQQSSRGNPDTEPSAINSSDNPLNPSADVKPPSLVVLHEPNKPQNEWLNINKGFFSGGFSLLIKKN